MNNNKIRKYARCIKKEENNLPADNSDDSEFSISGTAALGILGGTFLVGLVSGKLLCMLMKDR
ncbi:hypothetical protein LY28_01275 [Ruminiclostridium sufflavum DSM 19573]|uniref:Uncharacterized protein n=1 Tax=Ruminiclostridium sufflavum DSM 19573 TaxID=1121337 RepID=A0A318XLW3_9FIRM|nr:hypothetical protein [Ruminiclostridium sufflavum]PYG88427.1 hypothetical protein LY28_01275 [Ruminiclostridium sufflavum DSM 19573]